MNEIATREPNRLPTQAMSQDIALISLFERLATDPTIPLDRIEKLMEMQRQLRADRARDAFTMAMSEMQPKLPTIDRRGCIVITDKADAGKPLEHRKIIQSTKFATWEDISEALRPHLGEHGFALTFRAERAGDQVVVTGILRHREGHEETTTLSLAFDNTGSKNNVQGVGSSISYGKRYTAGMLLNFTSRAKNEADDDGTAAGAVETLSAGQIAELRKEMADREVKEAPFFAWIGYPTLEEIPAKEFQACIEQARRKPKVEKAAVQ